MLETGLNPTSNFSLNAGLKSGMELIPQLAEPAVRLHCWWSMRHGIRSACAEIAASLGYASRAAAI